LFNGDVYHCNFCGRPISPFKNGSYKIAEIHHLQPIRSKKVRASTWKEAVKEELRTGIEKLELTCGDKKSCHKLAHLNQNAKLFCPNCAKQGRKIGLKEVSRRNYLCPRCNQNWFKPDNKKNLVPASMKKPRFKDCPSCHAKLTSKKKRNYKCSKCGKSFRVSQSKKSKGELVQVP
jgi:DNA-directed RNA polymerase subunit RPC12/RpoP